MRRFALFGECLTAGLLVLLVALPVVTLLPALAAGCAHIKAHVDGETTAVRAFFERVRVALPGSWPVSIGVIAAFAVLAVDVVLLRSRVAGGGFVAVVCGVAAVGLAVVVLRAAAAWSPGVRWTALAREAPRHAVADLRGSCLLVMALGVLLIVTWQLPPLLLPMLGCVLMAAVAVDRRPATATNPS
ncbi:hypothetical protein ALI22I_02405 [Saccharothrix sp. ALI-22-I]|uniref:hypothetical protein n=1 Tax=Saccharothrix sp. ALI-22-I TaxID=1933778 RepID=UPI00097C1B3F|nr:hypothetical protein [Saccharothrix sp. ALI-22-I]ONI92687.1 hypothetical protein ALI22I_02405 [Saccharothrix sp. ALI-22-I]